LYLSLDRDDGYLRRNIAFRREEHLADAGAEGGVDDLALPGSGLV
jgi:hypothetical protein